MNVASKGNLNTEFWVHGQSCELNFVTLQILHVYMILLQHISFFPKSYSSDKKKNKSWITTRNAYEQITGALIIFIKTNLKPKKLNFRDR